MGGFEKPWLKIYKTLVSQGSTVIDVGANIGSHALPLAKIVGGHGKVIALEPTNYAYSKLLANISLNPNEKKIIWPCQIYVTSKTHKKVPHKIYARWPLGKKKRCHPVHFGASEKTSGAKGKSLDQICHDLKLTRLDLLKIDTDGNEADVLISGMKTIQRLKPKIVMEWAEYLIEKNQMSEAFAKLSKIGYKARFDKIFWNKKVSLDRPDLIQGIWNGSFNLIIEPTKVSS